MKPIVAIVDFPEEHSLVDARGRTWRFEWHDYLGPTVLRADGEPRAKQPAESSPFWPALTAWQAARKAKKT